MYIDNGVHTVSAKAYDNENDTDSDQITLSAGAVSQTLEQRIASSMDDVEENQNGSIYTNSSDIELVADGSRGNQTIGLRFTNINIPQGATIDAAYIQFTCDETNSGGTSLTVKGEDVNHSSSFTTSINNVSNRTTTSASTSWSPSSWSSVGAATSNERTPSLKNIVQEIINRGGWSSGNAMSFIITGTGERTAESYDGVSSSAALVHIEYTVGGSGNQSPTVAVTSPANGANLVAEIGNTISLAATASDADGSVSNVAFYVDGNLVGTDNSAPYSLNWTIPAEGDFDITAVATDNNGATTTSSVVHVNVTEPTGVTTTFEVKVSNGNDDAEEAESGNMYLNSSDLELVYDSYNSAGNQEVGIRFRNVVVPNGAIITNAYIQFTCDETANSSGSLTIKGEDEDNASIFTTTSNNISNRSNTTTSVNWTPSTWNTVGEAGSAQRTPDLTSIVQEIVDRGGWSSGNAMAFMLSGTGKRVAESYNGSASKAPLLHIEYELNGVKLANTIVLDEHQGEAITFFPNPTQDWLHIENHDEEAIEINIYSMNGILLKTQMIEKDDASIIPVEDLKNGAYVLIVNTTNGIEQHQFTKY